jgi:Adaptor complexes medium subunit family
VAMGFNVPMYSASPLKVLYLKIQERSNYAVEKWARKVCKAGDYHCRTK